MPVSSTQFWPYQAIYSWSRTDGTLTDQSRLWLNALYRTVATNGGGGGGSFTAGGDLSGTSTSQTVTGIEGRPVSATAPTNGQVLTWSTTDGKWEPKATAPGYVLPPATPTVLGGVKVGTNISVQADGTISVTTVLSGTGSPSAALGAVGDYYLDTASGTLYGPKAAAGGGTYGPGESALASHAPESSSQGTYSLGSTFTFSVAGRVTAVRHYRYSDGPGSRFVAVWKTDGTLLQSATSSEAGSGGWVTTALPAPIAVQSGDSLVASYDDPNNATFAVFQAMPPSDSPHISVAVPARYSATVSGFPSSSGGSPSYGADVVFEPLLSSTAWPVAIGPYALSPATTSVLGGVKIGANVSVAGDGTISVAAPTVPAAVRETPGGAMNGTNLVFTLSFAPNPAASLTLWLNGVEQVPTTDYTLSGATITYTVAPKNTDLMLAQYTH